MRRSDAEMIEIAVVSDVICPWCYIGQHRLKMALNDGHSDSVALRWQPFQLNPRMPRSGMDRGLYLARKFGGTSRAQDIYMAIANQASNDGLEVDFDAIQRTPNTLDAHRLIFWSERTGYQDEVVTLLFRAYFCEGRDIGTIPVLTAIAGNAGMDPVDVAERLASGVDRERVTGQSHHYQTSGINGVPRVPAGWPDPGARGTAGIILESGDSEACRTPEPRYLRSGIVSAGHDTMNPRNPSRNEFIALIALLFSMVAFATDAMLPALAEISADLALENVNHAQLVITVFVLGTGMGQLVTGPLSDSFGRKTVICLGIVIFLFASLWAFFATSMTELMIARFVQGLGVSAPRTVTHALVRDLYSGRHMARIVSFAMMLFVLIPAVAPLIGQTIMLALGWRYIFAAFQVVAVIAIAWLFFRQPRNPFPRQASAVSTPGNHARGTGSRDQPASRDQRGKPVSRLCVHFCLSPSRPSRSTWSG